MVWGRMPSLFPFLYFNSKIRQPYLPAGFETIHSQLQCNIIHDVWSCGCSEAIAKGIKGSRDLWVKDKNFFSPNFSSVKHCTNKNEKLAFLQPYYPDYFPALSECLSQLLFDSFSCLRLYGNVRNRKASVSITKWCSLELCWVLLSAAPRIMSSRVKHEKFCLSANEIIPSLCWLPARLWNGIDVEH